MKPGEEFQPLMDDIFREKVLRARRMTPEERIRTMFELYEHGVRAMRGGVRAQHPEWDEAQITAEVSRRFARVRQVAEWGIYHPVSPV